MGCASVIFIGKAWRRPAFSAPGLLRLLVSLKACYFFSLFVITSHCQAIYVNISHEDIALDPELMDATTHPTLYLIRHGETDWNARRLLQGRRDIPLNARGRSQAVASGACLNWLLPAPAEVAFIASPLGRTRETMQIVRQQLGLPAEAFETDDRLMEIDFGEWEGLGWEDIAQRDPQRYQARQADPLNYTAPGGENYPMVFERVGALLATLKRDTVLVAHAGVLRSCLALLAGAEPEQIPGLEIPQDRVLVIRGAGFAWLSASTALDAS
jgi:probable phosphoglycerate mutase